MGLADNWPGNAIMESPNFPVACEQDGGAIVLNLTTMNSSPLNTFLAACDDIGDGV